MTTTVSTNYRLITLNAPGKEADKFYVAMPERGAPNFYQHWRSLTAFKHREMQRAWGKDYETHKKIVYCEISDPNMTPKAFSLQRGIVLDSAPAISEIPVVNGLMALYERIGYDMKKQCYKATSYEGLPATALR